MHFNNVGLLATVLMASTASALPRMPHNGAVAPAAGALDSSQKSGNLVQRSEERTASQDNADFLFNLGDGEDSDDEGDDGSTSRHYHVSNRDNGDDLIQRSEANTATNDNEDFMFNSVDDEGNYRNIPTTRISGYVKRSEANTATNDNEDFMYSATGDEGYPNLRAPWRGGKTERSEEETASKDNAGFGVSGGEYGGYGGYGDNNGQGRFY